MVFVGSGASDGLQVDALAGLGRLQDTLAQGSRGLRGRAHGAYRQGFWDPNQVYFGGSLMIYDMFLSFFS